MNEASLKVLRMVADGKLSAEQADELLMVLGDEPGSVTVEEQDEQEPQEAGQSAHDVPAMPHDFDHMIAMQSIGKETA